MELVFRIIIIIITNVSIILDFSVTIKHIFPSYLHYCKTPGHYSLIIIILIIKIIIILILLLLLPFQLY